VKRVVFLSLVISCWACAGRAQDAGPPGQPVSALIETHNYDFDHDLDLDKQPDFWVRTIDRLHPHYVTAELDFTTGQAGGGSLVMRSEGAPAEFLSPPVSVDGQAAYDVSGYIKAEALPPEGLRATRARIEARIYDKDGNAIASVECFPEVTGTSDWRLVSAGDVTRKFPAAASLRVAAVLDGLSLAGSAWYDTIEVRKRPIAFFRTNRAGNCFYCADKKLVSLEAQGLPPAQYALTLVVRDAGFTEVHKVSLETTAAADGTVNFTYALPVTDPGPYTVEVALSTAGQLVLSQSIRMGVLPDRTWAETGKNFGISLSRVPASDSPQFDLTVLIGGGWVKMPLSGAETSSKTQYLRTLSELRRQGITPVGVLKLEGNSTPPEDGGSDALIDALLKGRDAWMPLFGDTINTFAGSVQWWQVGDEQDVAAAVDPAVVASLTEMKKFMNSVSYQAKLGVPAASLDPSMPLGGPATQFVSTNEAVFTQAPSNAPGAAGGREVWVWTDCAAYLTGDAGSAGAGAAENLSRLFAGGARIIFFRDPWTGIGVLDGEGNVTAFALVLATFVRELANYPYSGSIALPNNTPNAVFSTADNTKVLLWPAAQPKEERIFLGELVDVIDIYGNRTLAPIVEGENVILVDKAPVILDRIEPAVVETRKTFSIEPDVIDSIYEVQPVYVTVTNCFKTPIAGDLILKFPPGWEARPNVFFVRLNPGASFRGRANLVVPYNALSGLQEITATLMLGDLGSQRITIVERKQLSSNAFKMEIEMRPSGTGVLIYQKVTNTSGRPADVSAFLEGEGLERVERLPRRIEPDASTTFSYTLADAAAWNGRKLRVALREIKTNRFLNDEFTVSTAPQQ